MYSQVVEHSSLLGKTKKHPLQGVFLLLTFGFYGMLLVMNKEEIIKYWREASDSDFDLSKNLFDTTRYSYSLFFLHLSIEKLLKGLIVNNTDQTVPFEHNLVRLAEIAKISCSEEQLDLLSDITTFNIKGRYDDYKNQFYKIATREYAQKYIQESSELILWLKNNFQKI